jgi:hypothetical protein
MTTSIPIACTLDAGAYAGRVRWIAALNRAALRAHDQRDLTLELRYDAAAEARVRELVRREQQCCAFLTFVVDASADVVVLRITAPPETRAALDAVFAPFLVTSDESAVTSGVGCASEVCGCAPSSGDGSGGAQSQAHTTERPDSRGGRTAGMAATSAGVAALACGVCCVLPFALPAATLSTLGGLVAVAAHAYWWALGVAAVAVAAGWVSVAWQRVRTGRRPARATVVAMSAATLVLGVAASWSLVETRIAAALRS